MGCGIKGLNSTHVFFRGYELFNHRPKFPPRAELSDTGATPVGIKLMVDQIIQIWKICPTSFSAIDLRIEK